MSEIDDMQGLRGGVIYAAAGVAPTTARTWGLQLGETRGTGHPRYDITDVVMLVMMRAMTQDASLSAGPVATTVNTLRPYLPDIIKDIREAQKRDGEWRLEGGPFAVVSRRPQPNLNGDHSGWLHILYVDDIGQAIADPRSGLAPIVLPIRRHINKALYGLERVLAGEVVADPEQD